MSGTNIAISVLVGGTCGVLLEELAEIAGAIEDAVRSANLSMDVKRGDPGSWPQELGCIDSPDTILSKATRAPSRQVCADALLALMCGNARQNCLEGVYLFLTIHDDLTCRKPAEGYYSFVFGSSGFPSSRKRFAVLSTWRFRDYTDDRLRFLRTMAQHEFGHMLGLVGREGDGAYAGKDKLYEGHCTNEGCAMKQVLSVCEVQQVAHESALLNGPFCDGCRQEISKRFGAFS